MARLASTPTTLSSRSFAAYAFIPLDRIEKAPLEKLIVSNTIPLTGERAKCAKIMTLSVAKLLGQAIRSIHEESSVSSLFV